MFGEAGISYRGEFVISKPNETGAVKVWCLGFPYRAQQFPGHAEAMEYICSFPDEQDEDA